LPYDFDPRATCPNWLAFLQSTFDSDRQCIDLAQEWQGYLTTPDTSLQKMLAQVGQTRSGKGTFNRATVNILGEENCAFPKLSRLGERFALHKLLYKTAAFIPDAHLSRHADAMLILELLLSISGEDPQDIDRKFQPELTGVVLKTRFTLATNQLPEFPDKADILRSRLLILPFPNSFLGKEDRELGDKLKAETCGILLWALEGLQRLRQNGGRFTIPVSSAPLMEQMSRLGSPVKAFLDDVGVQFNW
jgi:putative DNA primase/helicase